MEYTVNQIAPLGTFDEKYGQRYWGKVHEADMDISFNLMNPININKNDKLTWEEKLIKESKSGKEYIFLKKVKVNGEPVSPTKSESKWQPKDERQITKNMVWKNLLTFFDAQSLNSASKQWGDFWATVDEHTDMLLGASNGTSPEQTTVTDSLRDKFEKVKASKSPTGYDPMDDLPPLDAYEDEN